MQGDATMTIDDILDALATAGHVLPREAIGQAVARWDEVGPVLVAMLEDAARAPATDLSERNREILFFAIYLMAQMREARAMRPLCEIASHGDDMSRLIGDGIAEGFSAILARVFAGEASPLRALIEDTGADALARDAAVETLAWLTATGAIDRAETAAYLRELHATLQPQGENHVWVGWQEAISALGLEDLTPLVEDAFARGWIDEEVMGIADFRNDLATALEAGRPARENFGWSMSDVDEYDDVEKLLGSWDCFNPAPRRTRASLDDADQWRPAQPVTNPLRHVGRNDPCPCGSGTKFKKCCLGKAA